MPETFLAKITIPSVQDIIVRSRKSVDLFNSSQLVPIVLKDGLVSVLDKENVEFLVPAVEVLKDKNNLNLTNVSYIKIQGSKEDVKNILQQIEKKIRNSLIERLMRVYDGKKEYEEYKQLIQYQIESSTKIIWSAVKIEKENLLEKARNEVDKVVAYLKSTIEPDFNIIESFNIFDKTQLINLYYEDSFDEFLQNAINLKPELVKGAYLCEVCGVRTIIGATKEDYRHSLTKQQEGDRLCGFCFAKRHFQKKKFKSVVDIAVSDYPYLKEVKQIFTEEGFEDLIKEDIQNIYLNELEKTKDENIKSLIQKLKEFYKNHGNPSKYYAVLMIDGDSMGEKVSKAFEKTEDIKKFTKELSDFAKEVKEIVEKNKGTLVYSGGDDVLALLPVSTALNCYKQISDKFRLSTMSGGLIFSHYKLPLNYVLEELRKAESKAKDSGKKGIYIKYIKPSYSSKEAFIKKDFYEDFKKLIEILKNEKFPQTFIYQLEQLLLPYYPNTQETKIVKTLIEYLINKKNINKELKKDFLNLITYSKLFSLNHENGENNIQDLIDKLKVANFLAKEVKND